MEAQRSKRAALWLLHGAWVRRNLRGHVVQAHVLGKTMKLTAGQLARRAHEEESPTFQDMRRRLHAPCASCRLRPRCGQWDICEICAVIVLKRQAAQKGK